MGNVIEFEREDDGRWIADVPTIPGAMAYGATKHEAELKARAIADHIIAARPANFVQAPRQTTIDKL
jgi:predicted RNase H-like HicB family nuclease